MKKPIIYVLICTLLLSLCACAPKTNSTQKPSDPNISPTPTPVYEAYSLYFPSIEDNTLIKETQELQVNDSVNKEVRILSALKKGPKGDELVSPLSPNTEIISVKTISGLCTVNLSDDFMPANTSDDNVIMLSIQSIVHSLCQLDTVQQVKLNVGGKTDVKINDVIDLSQPFSPNEEILIQTK